MQWCIARQNSIEIDHDSLNMVREEYLPLRWFGWFKKSQVRRSSVEAGISRLKHIVEGLQPGGTGIETRIICPWTPVSEIYNDRDLASQVFDLGWTKRQRYDRNEIEHPFSNRWYDGAFHDCIERTAPIAFTIINVQIVSVVTNLDGSLTYIP